jgi:hypothetical protein
MSTRIFNGANAPIEVTGATTAKGGQSYVLKAAAGAAITLPAPSTYFEPIKFTVGQTFATTNWTVVTAGSANVIQGSVEVAGAVVAGVAEDTISFVATAESLGDHVTVSTDGTSIFVQGQAALSGGITLTQAN